MWAASRQVGGPVPPPAPVDTFATWDPADKSSFLGLSSGNLLAARIGTSGEWHKGRATIAKSHGKHYFEVQHTVDGPSGGGYFAAGLASVLDTLGSSYVGGGGTSAEGAGFIPTWPGNARRYRTGTGVDLTGYGRIASTGGWMGVAVDFDAGKIWFRINGSAWVGGGDPVTGTSPTYTFTPNFTLAPAVSVYQQNQSCLANFGATAFNATPPTGYEGGWYAPGLFGTPVYVSQFTASGSTDAQGVATDGTHVWFSNSTTIFKYTKAGALVTSRVVSGDAPTGKSQVNGMRVLGGVLYVSAAENSTPRKSWIVQYDPDTLAYIAHNQITGDWFSEGIDYKDGHWWVTFHANMVVAKVDPSTWAVVATYPLNYGITGSSGGFGAGTGYESGSWIGDYFLCNIHEIYDQNFLDVYHFTGTYFEQVARIPHVTSIATQGIAVDPVEPGVIWFAQRNYSGTDSVAKTTYYL
jgi:hypothetical protein